MSYLLLSSAPLTITYNYDLININNFILLLFSNIIKPNQIGGFNS
jgi:hypothetical protein